MAKLAWNRIIQELDGDAAPYAGAQLFTYQAGSSTKETTYQDSDGTTPHANPIILDANGRITAGVYLTEGQAYKFVLAPSDDTDPPASPIWTLDDIEGINDANVSVTEWQASNLTPTYVSASSFTLTGDQTSVFHTGRRLKIADAGGTKYATIRTSVYAALTTVTVDIDAAGSLSSPLASAAYGMLAATNHSVPVSVVWSTGDVKVTFKTTADTGWVLMNDGTIGNGSSGGTARANADTLALFTLLWTNTVDADCAVSTGRGANAAADFAANKTIALPKVLGRDLAVYGAGSGLTARALASVLGAETKTIGTTNLPASGLSIPSLSVTATGTGTETGALSTGGGGALANSANGANGDAAVTIDVSVSGSTGTGTTGNMGSGNALDIMNPRFHANVMIKL